MIITSVKTVFLLQHNMHNTYKRKLKKLEINCHTNYICYTFYWHFHLSRSSRSKTPFQNKVYIEDFKSLNFGTMTFLYLVLVCTISTQVWRSCYLQLSFFLCVIIILLLAADSTIYRLLRLHDPRCPQRRHDGAWRQHHGRQRDHIHLHRRQDALRHRESGYSRS